MAGHDAAAAAAAAAMPAKGEPNFPSSQAGSSRADTQLSQGKPVTTRNVARSKHCTIKEIRWHMSSHEKQAPVYKSLTYEANQILCVQNVYLLKTSESLSHEKKR